ncbi:MAG: Fic family protein [Bacteroidetes bacterium]|nr:Fic family protein [Bacteroidota bacterium]
MALERKQGHHLRQLRSIETVRSTAASTRIEGSRMTDDEVDAFLAKLDVQTLEDRDEQEVAGYYDAANLVLESWEAMPVNENTVKLLHRVLMRYSQKDQWHAGDYKRQSNTVEATLPDGSKHEVFRTEAPGLATQEAMRRIMTWYAEPQEVHPLVAGAALVYDVLSIHPFQDGNGRISRLLTTLALLKSGYHWVQYVSFEHEIELRKQAYYRTLRESQQGRPGEDITAWVAFFLDALIQMSENLNAKLHHSGIAAGLSDKEELVLQVIANRPHIQSGELSSRLDIPLPSVKRMLGELVNKGLIERHGKGRGTSYTSN